MCEFAEFQVYGQNNYKTDITSLSSNIVCDVNFNLNGASATLTQKVTFTSTKTPIVTNITPRFGY